MDMKNKPITKDDLKNFKREFLEDFTYSLMQQMMQMNKQMALLTEQINVLNQHRYGRHTERRGVDGQMEFLINESEIIIAEASAAELKEPVMSDINPQNTDVTKAKKKPHPKGTRKEMLKALPEESVSYRLTGEGLGCECGGSLKPIGKETIQRLEFHPASLKVVNQEVYSYKCDSCGKIVRADHPLPLFEGSLATPSLMAGIMTAKFTNALPYYRIESSFADTDAFISRQTMARWVIRTADVYFSLLYERMKKELLSCDIIHADETTVEVKKDGRKPGSKSYMWVYTDEGSDRPVVIYEYQKTRAAGHAKEFLADYKGYLCCDGYEGYHSLGSDITVCGCMVHAKRHFSNAVKVLKNLPDRKNEYSVSEEAVRRIADIFHTDNQWRDLPYEEHHRNRNTILKEKVDSFYEWIGRMATNVPPKSETGKGISYCVNQKKYLLGFLNDPRIPLDNNEAERKIRNFVISRKNFVLIDTVNGAEASAVMFSISETVKANKLKSYEYFEYVLSEMPKHMKDNSSDMSFIENLMPWSKTLPERIHKAGK